MINLEVLWKNKIINRHSLPYDQERIAISNLSCYNYKKKVDKFIDKKITKTYNEFNALPY